MNISAKKFIFFTLIGFVLVLFAYVFTFNFLVQKDIYISHSYKEFLLENTDSPRLIIDSGSNSQHAINSQMLEEQFNILTINIADNGGYPLRQKLLRLNAHAKKGDIVILPLEWGHYTYQNPTQNYLDNIFTRLNFYYNSLSLFEKIRLISQTPFSSFVKALMVREKMSLDSKLQTEYLSFQTFQKNFIDGDRADYKYNGPLPLADDGTKIKTCNEYVFGEQLIYGFKISNVFKENMSLVHDLEKKGVKVILTWPAVAGDNCYQGKYSKEFFAFMNEIKNYLDKEKITYIGSVEDSRFDKKMMLNTFYHVIDTARDIRTQKLIENIRTSKVNELFIGTSQMSDILIKNVFNDINKFTEPIKMGEKVYFTSNKFSNNSWLIDGWYPMEKEGTWSYGNSSSILIKIDDDLKNKNIDLVIEADTFKEKNPTRIYVNEVFIGAFVLNGKKEININNVQTNKDGIFTIKFLHENIKSPAEYGMNNDERKLKLRLRAISLNLK